MQHSNFHAINMNNVDIILGCPWWETSGTININVQKFMKIFYKKNKTILSNMSLNKQQRPKVPQSRSLHKEKNCSTS